MDDTGVAQHKLENSTTTDSVIDSRKIIGNILALGSSEIVARFFAFIATVYVARELGPAGFGILGFALAISLYFSLAVHAGFNDIGAREVARRPHEARSIAASVIPLRLVLALIALGAIGTLTLFLDKPVTVKLVMVLMGLSFF